MKYLYLLSFLVIFINIRINAQQSIVGIGVYVYDSLSQRSINNCTVTIMDMNRTVLSEPRPVEVIKNKKWYRFDAFVPRHQQYIIKVALKGYETELRTLKVEKNEKEITNNFFLKREPIPLDEVTITGSKILMVNRGDTIVYNASAFQLSNGSMLDALVRQLPGVELKQGGRITVNGKFVSSLLVNGRDFFKGDPKIALENLPSYYVNNIKVYHKVSRLKQVMYGDSIKADENTDPLVMDVNLKRDYAEGWISNASIGYGTNERYIGKLFGMRYTNHSGLFLFGNLNNLNNDNSADKGGNWQGDLLKEGMVSTKTFGINFTGDDKITQMSYETSAKLSFTNKENEDITSADNYYSTEDIYLRSKSHSNHKRTKLEWNGNFTYPKSGKFYFYILPSLSYDKVKHHGFYRSASFMNDPVDSYRGASIDSLYSLPGSSRLTSMLINQREQHQQGESDKLNLLCIASGSFPVYSKWMELSAMGRYGNENNDQYERDNIGYSNEKKGETNLQNRYSDLSNRNYEYRASVKYNLIQTFLPNSQIELSSEYSYHQQYNSGKRQLYRMDIYDQYATGCLWTLPSTTDSMQAAIDLKNSYQTSTLSREHRLTFNLRWNFLQIRIPVTWNDDQLTDNRNNHQNTIHRHRPHMNFLLSYYKGIRGKGKFAYSYELVTRLPSMNYLLDVRDDADPLLVSLGNPDLKNSYYHVLSVSYEKIKTERQKQFSFSHNIDIVQNGVCIGRKYDLGLGITTTRPENISGNWSTWGRLAYGQQIDKRKHLSFTNTIDYRYHHSVDYATLDQSNSLLSKNIVHNLTLGETLKADYHLKDWYIAATGHAILTHATSPMSGFTTINAVDYNYGLTITKSFLKYFDVDSELMMWSRRGYTDSTMNDDQLVWNLMLTYSFGKMKQWMLKVEGHDILHQVSSVRLSLNAQGRTETWYKTVPSYWMLHLAYQFKKEPKKRNQ